MLLHLGLFFTHIFLLYGPKYDNYLEKSPKLVFLLMNIRKIEIFFNIYIKKSIRKGK